MEPSPVPESTTVDKQQLQPFFLSTYRAKITEKYEYISFVPTLVGTLYLGAAYRRTETWLDELQEKKVKFVYAMGFDQWPPFSPWTPHSFVPMAEVKSLVVNDSMNPESVNILREQLKEFVTHIHEDLKTDKPVFVHCHAGVSRSATAVIYYLMLFEGMSFVDAFLHVRKARPIICPNSGFVTLLQRFDFQMRNLFWLNIWPKIHELSIPKELGVKGRIFWGPESLPNNQPIILPDHPKQHRLGFDIQPETGGIDSILLPSFADPSSLRNIIKLWLDIIIKHLNDGEVIYLCSVDGCGMNLIIAASLLYYWKISLDSIREYFRLCLPMFEQDFIRLVPLLVTLN